MSTFFVKQGDYHRQLTLELAGLSSTGASEVRFRMRPQAGGSLTVDRVGTIVSAGRVALQFQAPELDTAGNYLLEASLVYVDGRETVPTQGYVTVVVVPALGT